MAFKPNYNHEKMARTRAKQQKKQEKLEKKQEAARQKAEAAASAPPEGERGEG